MAKPPVKAQELADALAEQIQSGSLGIGTWLPAERQLAESRGVGRSTVRQATQMLTERGMVEVVAGSGVRVVKASDPRRETADGEAPADVRGELIAIRGQLREINDRLAAIENRTAGGAE